MAIEVDTSITGYGAKAVIERLGSARGLRGLRPGVRRPGAQLVGHERKLRWSFIRGRLNASYPAVQRR